jgi:hypothetical protein
MNVWLDGKRLKQLRGDTKQIVVSDPDSKVGAGVSLRTLRDAEGDKKHVSYETAQLLAAYYGVEVDTLIRDKVPELDFLRVSDKEQKPLLTASFEAYRQLFPEPVIQDHTDDIETWLSEAEEASEDDPWRELWGVLHWDLEAFRIIYLTCHLERDFCCGNYFGLLPGAPRMHGRAKRLLREDVSPYLQAHIKRAVAILFEIEPIDFDFLAEIERRERLSGHGDEARITSNLNCLERLLFYNIDPRVVCALTKQRRPMPYFHPAMKSPLSAVNERPWMLMAYVYGCEPEKLDIPKAIDFLFDDIYMPAYDGSGLVGIEGYERYIREDVKPRILQHAAESSFSKLLVPQEIRWLISRAKREGLLQKD